MRSIQRIPAVRLNLARYAIALIAGAVTPSMTFAQQPPTPPARQSPARPAAPPPQRQAGPAGARPDQAGRGAPGGRPDRFGPGGGVAGMLIAMKAQLELTDDQLRKLEALRDAPHPKRNEAELLRARADMVEAMQGDGDLTKARAALDKMSRMRTDEQIARLKQRQDVRNVLTAAQKTKLDNMRGMLRNRMRGMNGGRKGHQKWRKRGGPDGMGPGMPGMPEGMRQRMQQRMQMGPGMGGGQGFAPGGRRGGMDAPGGGMGPGMGPGMMGPGMGPGVGPGDTGPNGPGSMRPAMGRRGPPLEPDVNNDKRPPVPPSDSLSIR